MTGPTPPIDPAVRTAVLRAECLARGHIPIFTNMMYSSQNGGSTDMFGSQDATQLPHVECRRCGLIWVMIETGEHSYADAFTKLQGVVTDHKIITPKPRPAEDQQ